MPATPSDPGGPPWRVTGQMETTRSLPGGQFVKGVEVTFTTRNGNTGTVFLPEQLYNAANVRQAVEVKAAQMDSIGSLTG